MTSQTLKFPHYLSSATMPVSYAYWASFFASANPNPIVLKAGEREVAILHVWSPTHFTTTVFRFSSPVTLMCWFFGTSSPSFGTRFLTLLLVAFSIWTVRFSSDRLGVKANLNWTGLDLVISLWATSVGY